MCGGTSGRTTVGVPNSFKKVLHLALFMIQNLKILDVSGQLGGVEFIFFFCIFTAILSSIYLILS